MKIGDRLNLLMKDVENKLMIEYRCKIIGKDQNYIFIDYPIHKDTNRTAFLPNGTHLLAIYIDKDKQLYEFHTIIQKHITLTMPGLAINLPTEKEVKQIQRREYVRVMTAVDIAIHPIDQSFFPFSTVTNDISGGGVSIVIPEDIELKNKQMVSLIMVLHLKSEIKYIHLQGKIIRIFHHNKVHQTASIKFVSIPDNIRQVIIQFVFDKQREERNKELI